MCTATGSLGYRRNNCWPSARARSGSFLRAYENNALRCTLMRKNWLLRLSWLRPLMASSRAGIALFTLLDALG